MVLGNWKEKVPVLMRKYKYAIMVLAIGLVLLMLPTKLSKSDTLAETKNETSQNIDPAKELQRILETIQGVGKVQVLLTVKTGERVVYQTDEHNNLSDNASSIQKETVIITDSQRNEHALVVQVLPPVYLGAVIVCQGAENAAVRLAIVDAVRNATGLGADRISVQKMK